MTDKELLEYAAKAAGVDGKVRRVQGLYQTNYHLGVGKNRWNPLESDADAFRLAVKLTVLNGYRISIPNVDEGEDQYATTRRAIVETAAEIGKEQA